MDPDPGFGIFADADQDPDPGCEIFADLNPDPDLELDFFQKLVFFLREKLRKELWI